MNDVASALRSEVGHAAARFTQLTESEAGRDRGQGKWVTKEVLGHLIDSAINNHQRFVRAQLGNAFSGPGYDQEAWVQLQGYRERPWLELVELWVALNGHVAAVIERVPAEKLQTPCTIGDHEPASLEWWMRDYVRHLRHHLAQIAGE
jgi:hypothetical protein